MYVARIQTNHFALVVQQKYHVNTSKKASIK